MEYNKSNGDNETNFILPVGFTCLQAT